MEDRHSGRTVQDQLVGGQGGDMEIQCFHDIAGHAPQFQGRIVVDEGILQRIILAPEIFDQSPVLKIKIVAGFSVISEGFAV